MASSLREQRSNVEALTDPFARNSLRVAYHVRRYVVLYVCALLGLVALALFPTYSGNGGGGGAQSVAAGQGVYGNTGGNAANGTGVAGAGAGAAPGAAPGVASTAGAPTVGAVGGGGAATSGSSGGGAAVSGGGAAATGGGSTVAVGQGVTRGGVKCAKGVRQLPFSHYAAPCVAKFTGNNGGKTWNGVTANQILIVHRHTSDANGANEQATNAQIVASGGDTYEKQAQQKQALVKYFNSTFELYGRQVVLKDWNGQGNYTSEELGQGQAAACADADYEANSLHAFSSIDFEGNFEWGPFATCAARYKMYLPQAAPYFPESYYRKINPYGWSTIMNCSNIAAEVGEFIGKQIAPYPAQWAGNDGATSLKNTQRKFATFVPDNAEYQECVNQTKAILSNTYHVSKARQDQYNYKLDISQFPNDAQRAAIQFAANKDTTVLLACDPISPIFLTKDTANQGYYPEYLIIGVAYTDSDNWAQLWDQTAVSGRLFGLSQAAATAKLLDPNGEAGQVLRKIGLPVDLSSVTNYYELLSLFNQLQAAGPDLTPANIAAGTHSLPVSSPGGAWGTWFFGPNHTAVVDSREVYWVANKTSTYNGKPGSYVEIFNGRRFQPGQFPTGKAPFYGG
jgi:hypothetical protein